MSAPTLDELRALDREATLRGMEAGIRRDARARGLPDPDRADLWALLRELNEARDEDRRPELERRAARLGVRTRTLFGRRRSVTEISLDCWDEEERRRLAARFGHRATS